jgi:hypothetical protein
MTAIATPASPDHRSGLTFKSLSPARRRLLATLQDLNFGRIERLEVRGGEPVVDESLTAVREVKFGGDNAPRPEAALPDFVLKEQHLSLLALLDAVGDGTIAALTCKHGVPPPPAVPG